MQVHLTPQLEVLLHPPVLHVQKERPAFQLGAQPALRVKQARTIQQLKAFRASCVRRGRITL